MEKLTNQEEDIKNHQFLLEPTKWSYLKNHPLDFLPKIWQDPPMKTTTFSKFISNSSSLSIVRQLSSILQHLANQPTKLNYKIYKIQINIYFKRSLYNVLQIKYVQSAKQ